MTHLEGNAILNWLVKFALSALVLAVSALLILPTALAFGVREALRTWLQWLQVALSLAAAGCVWKEQGRWAMAALGSVALITAIILAASG